MASGAGRNPSHRPKRYPDAVEPHQVIQLFFAQQPDFALEAEFTLLCKRNPRDYGLHLSWLVKNGCSCSVAQIKAWLRVKGIKSGTEAQQMNAKAEEYAGVDFVGGLESIAVKTANLTFDYAQIIQTKLEGGELTEPQIQSIIAQYPALVGQTKQILQALGQVKQQEAERELLLSGADRMRCLVLNMVEKSSPFRPALEQYFQAALQRIAEEI